jgi:hypothetical protein
LIVGVNPFLQICNIMLRVELSSTITKLSLVETAGSNPRPEATLQGFSRRSPICIEEYQVGNRAKILISFGLRFKKYPSLAGILYLDGLTPRERIENKLLRWPMRYA